MFVYDNDARLIFVIEDAFLFFQSELLSVQDLVFLLVWSLLKYMCRISKICCAWEWLYMKPLPSTISRNENMKYEYEIGSGNST